jgi:ribose transport system substrate-binding protein
MKTPLKVLPWGAAVLFAVGAVLGFTHLRPRAAPPAMQGPGVKEKPRWLIGLSIHQTSDDYGAYLSKSFQKTLEEAQVDYIITDAQANARKQQEDLERHVARRVDALVIVPFDDQIITQGVNKAAEQGIPIVAITEMPGSRVTTTILGREHGNGYDAGMLMAQKLSGKGKAKVKVMVLDVPTDLTRIRRRHEGFRDALRKTRLEIVAIERAVSKEECMAAVEGVLRKHPDLQGIFAPYGLGLVGAGSALRAYNREDIVVTGIDADFEVLKLIDEGWVAAALAQYPNEHGRLAAEAALRILREEPLTASVEAPFKVVTQENAVAMARELWNRELR